MKILQTVLLYLLISTSVFSDWAYPPGVNSEFESFFGEPIASFRPSQIRLITEKLYEYPYLMPIKMEFDIEGVEKILLLKVPDNGYDSSGVLHLQCANEPVFIASYTVDPEANISEIEARIRTRCISHHVTLMLWVKTAQGYYLDTATFHTTNTESDG